MEESSNCLLATTIRHDCGDILRKTLRQLTGSEQQLLGSPTEDIAAHSLRKGSSTYTLAQVNGPNPVTVFLRMGQSLGRLKDRYIHYGEGADQLCGRMVCGLPFDRLEFGVLPPHFKNEVTKYFDLAFWQRIVPGYLSYPTGVRSGFPFFLASLFHHESFLREHLPAGHPIFLARVFTQNSLLSECRAGSVLCIGRSDQQQLKCTSIPPHLSIARELNEVYRKIGVLANSVTQLQRDLHTNVPDQIAVKVGDYIRKSFNVVGLVAVTMRDIDTRMGNLRDEITACMRELGAKQLLPTSSNGQQEHTLPQWLSRDWKDGLLAHCVPKGWDFPTGINMKTLWELWHYGDRGNRIRPYRYLKNVDIKTRQKMRFTRTKKVMTHVNHLINASDRSGQCNQPSSGPPTIHDDATFNAAYAKMLTQLYGEKMPSRPEEISYCRLYNLLCKYRKQNKNS